MKKILCLLFFLPLLAWGGVLEDLQEAMIRRDSEAAIKHINRGMDVNTVDSSGNTLLIQSIQHDIPDLFEFLMNKRARFNIRNKNGESALSIAAYTGKMEYVKRLIESGAEVNSFGWSALSYAAFNGHVEVAEYLIRHGADVNAPVPNGGTALFMAARNGHKEVVKVLLDNKADPGVANENGETAVDWALNNKNTNIAEMIQAAGGRSGKQLTIEISK